MHIHEQVLETANQLASARPDYTFSVEEVVRSLRHLNESSVRTHVGSRCCINAPSNHLHRWDYFRRVGRGTYQVTPKYRKGGSGGRSRHQANAANLENPSSAHTRLLRETIHAVIQKNDSTYTAECMELAVVTQGDTLDQVTANLRHAISLHLEDEDIGALGLAPRLRLQLIYDVPLAS